MPETWWRLGPEVLPGPAAVTRAIDLLDAGVERPVLSWSLVTEPVLVAGRAAPGAALNHHALALDGVDVVQRRSGGGPVLWGPELVSLDVCVPPAHRLAGHDVTLAYRWLGEAVSDALSAAGVPTHVVQIDVARHHQSTDDPVRLRAARACFGGLSPFEVVAEDGRKVVGLAQVRRRSGVLFQCGIALTFPSARLARYLESAPSEIERMEAALESVAAGLRDYRPELTVEAVIAAVEVSIANREGITFDPMPAGAIPKHAPDSTETRSR